MTDSARLNTVSTGVQALIDQLKEQGVNSGREEAAAIIAEARSEAESIILQARINAEDIEKTAQQQADFTIKAGTDALKLAERDAVLELKEFLIEQFSQHVASLVSESLTDSSLIRAMILEVAGKQKPASQQAIEVLLPEQVVGIEELRRNPELLKQGGLLEVVMDSTASMLRDGVTFATSPSSESGIHLKLQGQTVEIDLGDKAVTAILLQHLQPRFRALLEGIIK